MDHPGENTSYARTCIKADTSTGIISYDVLNNDNREEENIQTELAVIEKAQESRTRYFILEPAVFLVFLSLYLSNAVYQNQLLYQTCVAVLQYNQTECIPMLGVQNESPEAQRIETQVQPTVARILMVRSLLESIIPALVSLLIGPWSDKFGRKPIILITLMGYFVGFIILTVISFIATKIVVSPWIFLISSITYVLSGGTCALLTGIYSYISDVANEESRAVRMLCNEASLSAGIVIGSMASGYLYEATNATTMFFCSSILMTFALIYVNVFVVESLRCAEINRGSKIREFFRFDLIKDLLRACFRRRPNFDRAIIWLTIVCVTVALFTIEGDNTITYLFFRKRFQWTLKDYTFFNATRIIVQIIGNLTAMIILSRILKLSVVTLTLISIASCILESTVRATATVWWEIYMGMILGSMRGILGPMSRAILSNVTPVIEVGKIYAVTTSLESMTPLISAPLYTMVYNSTLEFDPGLFNFISAGLLLFCFALIAIIPGLQLIVGKTAAQKAVSSQSHTSI